MKIFKGFFLVIFFLCLLITMVSLLMPSKVMTSNMSTIHAEPGKIMPLIQDLKNWRKWYPSFTDSIAAQSIHWEKETSNMLVWQQNSHHYQLEMQKTDSSYCQVLMKTEGEPDLIQILSVNPVDIHSQQVEWKMVMTLRWYPWEKFSGIFFDKAVGPACLQGLESLKKIAESNQQN